MEVRCENDRLFGDERLIEVVNQRAGEDIEKIPQAIFNEVKQRTIGGLPDDIVMLAIGLREKT